MNPESELILEKLKTHGWNISWGVDADLGGYAATNMDEQWIRFRNEASLEDKETIHHELLHCDLYDKGYPVLKPANGWSKEGIWMLNDVFQHIMIKPEIEHAGFSIGTKEIPATLKSIGSLASGTPVFNEPYWAALYIRGHFLEIEDSKLAPLEKYIQENHTGITMDKIMKAIGKLPEHGCSVEKYTKCLNEVVSTLGLDNEVVVKKRQ